MYPLGHRVVKEFTLYETFREFGEVLPFNSINHVVAGAKDQRSIVIIF